MRVLLAVSSTGCIEFPPGGKSEAAERRGKAHPSAHLARWGCKMMKKLAFAFAPLLAPLAMLSACADEPEALPEPDPALIEQIALANTAETQPSRKLEKADKLVASVAHVEPDRVAGAAEKLLAR
ncbi:MAG TPA: hypothetical protein VF688_12005 [Allosphingosinicella sp.]|jgi:hypothetical protein